MSVVAAELPDRSRRILALLVRAYIERREPVSSLWLARQSGLGLSSATVRNVLAQLEAQGYIRQPHTSSGRVPTDLGYRFYVDLLLQARRPARPAPGVEARLRQAGTVEELLANVSEELSRASHHLGFALAPASDAARFKHIDFVPLEGTRVLIVMIATGGQIGHKVVELDEAIRSADLQHAANYLNREFAGMTLRDVREALVERMRQERTLYDALLSRALRLAQFSFDHLVPQHMLVVQGAASLLDEVAIDLDRTPLETLQALFRMIEEKHRLVRLLSAYIEDSELVVVIGAEHPAPDLRHFSLIASTYRDGDRTGTVGVIGPVRMRYSRAISAVDSMSQAVSRVLGSEV